MKIWNRLWLDLGKTIGHTWSWQNLSDCSRDKKRQKEIKWGDAWTKWKGIYKHVLESLQKREATTQTYTPIARTRQLNGVLYDLDVLYHRDICFPQKLLEFGGTQLKELGIPEDQISTQLRAQEFSSASLGAASQTQFQDGLYHCGFFLASSTRVGAVKESKKFKRIAWGLKDAIITWKTDNWCTWKGSSKRLRNWNFHKSKTLSLVEVLPNAAHVVEAEPQGCPISSRKKAPEISILSTNQSNFLDDCPSFQNALTFRRNRSGAQKCISLRTSRMNHVFCFNKNVDVEDLLSKIQAQRTQALKIIRRMPSTG